MDKFHLAHFCLDQMRRKSWWINGHTTLSTIVSHIQKSEFLKKWVNSLYVGGKEEILLNGLSKGQRKVFHRRMSTIVDDLHNDNGEINYSIKAFKDRYYVINKIRQLTETNKSS